MILKNEIQAAAMLQKLAMSVVEKNYILGWILAGINQHSAIQKTWIFKGGTCLKKCYFETFRFSEDLDFTDIGSALLNQKDYHILFLEIAEWIYENSGIQLPEEGITFEVFNNNRGGLSVQGKLSYRGPLQPNLNVRRLPRVKIDLTLDEPLLLTPQIRRVNHLYSDEPEIGIEILSYAYEEIIAEKMRALIQRLRPRDLYDVIHLFRHRHLVTDCAVVYETLLKKCQHRRVNFPTMELIENHSNRQLVESEWSTQLKHQLAALPPFEEFITELPLAFEWISQQIKINGE